MKYALNQTNNVSSIILNHHDRYEISARIFNRYRIIKLQPHA